MADLNKERTARYYKSLDDKGLCKLQMIIPKSKREQVMAYVDKLRAAHHKKWKKAKKSQKDVDTV